MPRIFLQHFFSRPRGPLDKSSEGALKLFTHCSWRELGLLGAAAWWNTCGATNLSSRLMGSTLRDRTGERHGRLTVLRRGPSLGKTTRWWCECSCGRACVLVIASNLGRHAKSCGCWKEEERVLRKGSRRLPHPRVGSRFGRWQVVGPVPDIGYASASCTGGIHYEPAALVRCTCGSGAEKAVLVKSLVRGLSESCGCIKKEGNNFKHGHARAGRHTREYSRYMNMIKRCHDPSNLSWPDYGGRGISVCEWWLSGFENFLADMGPLPSPSHQIDRKDNNGNYEPDNCHWVTPRENARNRRNSIYVDVASSSIPLVEASSRLGVSYQYAWALHRVGQLSSRLEDI